MAAENAGGSKFAEFVTDHILGDVHGDELVAIMHGDGLADEVGRYHRSA